MPNVVLPEIDHIREAAHLMAAGSVATFGVPGMFRPRLWPATLMPEGTPGAISFYDSAPLKDTLDACVDRSEEHTSELQSLMRISYAVFCLKKKNRHTKA